MNYNLDYNQLWIDLTPPMLRGTMSNEWGAALQSPTQTLHDLIFDRYVLGSTDAATYSSSTTYSLNSLVYDVDRVVYKSATASNYNHGTTNSVYWTPIIDNYIGIMERIMYSSQKITFEFALNRWFVTTGIYIENFSTISDTFILSTNESNSSALSVSGFPVSGQYLSNDYLITSAYNFKIWVPTAKWTILASTDQDREDVIRSFADLFVMGGMVYSVGAY